MPECDMEKRLNDLVELEPFAHQVGGHSTVLRYNDSTVCKGLVLRELQFYKTMPNEMKQFTPQFRGVIEVLAHTDDDGYVTLVARPPARFHRNTLTSSLPNLTNEPVTQSGSIRASSLCPRTISTGAESRRNSEPGERENNEGDEEGGEDECFQEEETDDDKVLSDSDNDQNVPSVFRRHRFRIHRTGSVEIEGLSRGVDAMSLEEGGNVEEGGRVFSSKHNMWSLRCHQEHLAKINKGQPDQFFNKFILLENLTCNYRLPCVLDLKMGTRQHGDDASEEKKQSQMNKCHLTTSSCLGVRICGMQVYQVNTGKYVCHDKYFGRRLKEQGVRDTLHQFLHNGVRFHRELIQPIIARLHDLLSVLNNQETFRFYSSSLLIMYDAADWLIPDVSSMTKAPISNSLRLSDYENSDWIVLDSPADATELEARLGSNICSTVSLSSNITKNINFAAENVNNVADNVNNVQCSITEDVNRVRHVIENVSSVTKSVNNVTGEVSSIAENTNDITHNVSSLAIEKGDTVFGDSKTTLTQTNSNERNSAELTEKQNEISVERSFESTEIISCDTLPTERRKIKTTRTAKINVRMIDFAHSTHHGFLDDKTPHVGPDHGYLFGVQNLIKMFEELLAI